MNFANPFQKVAPNLRLGGRYQVIHQLGVGGFSETFLAKDTQLPGQPHCVIKQLKPQSRNLDRWQVAKRLFDTEAAVLYHLGDHERIPRLFAHFEDNQNFYLVQEFIEGESLRRKLVAGQPWSEARVVAVLQDILQILAYVHDQKVIHRDIKPSNLICRKADGKMVLIDFGAVKQVSVQTADSLSEHSMTISIGTQGYMPMEQYSGAPRFNSDIYALGIIGIEALTGIRPNQLRRDNHTGEIIWHGEPLTPDAVPVQVSAELADVLDNMVRCHFKERYQTAQEALQAIEALLGKRTDIIPAVEFTALAAEFAAPWHTPGHEEYSQPLPDPSPLPTTSASSVFATAAGTAVTATRFATLTTYVTQKVVSLQRFPAQTSYEILSILRSPGRALRRLSRSRTIPWHILLGVGGVALVSVLVSIGILNAWQVKDSQTTPRETPIGEASLLPLTCREPSPPALPSKKPNLIYADGTRYYGSVVDGLPTDGRGIMVFVSGNRYDGEFQNGKRNGCGTYTFVKGRRYVGQFKDDRFSGNGIWFLDNGDRYIGQFKDDRCHGEGTFIFADGTMRRGTWRNGQLEGSDLSCDR